MSKLLRGAVALVLGAALLGGAFARVPTARAAETCFDATGFCVGGVFLDYWLSHGGLATNGYPLSTERVETLENGETYTVQWFERVRLEYHPENAERYRVLLGQFGRHILATVPGAPVAPVAADPDGPATAYFPETGHNVRGTFLGYWERMGGLAQFGYPLSEEFEQVLEDGNTYTVQYFERARFEHHPELQAQWQVLLGQFGRRILAESAPANLAPCNANNLAVATEGDAGAGGRFATVYLTNTGTAACTLAGAPQVQLQSAAGSPLDVTVAAVDDAPVGLVVLAPSLMAHVGLRWTNWCGADPGEAKIRVTLPDNGGAFTTTGISTPPCLGEGQRSFFGVGSFKVDGPVGHANVVVRFYKAINAGDYGAAYALLGRALQAGQDYNTFAAGYANTERVNVTIVSFNGTTEPEATRIGVELAATQSNGSVQKYTGTYDIGAEGGRLLIVGASIAPAP